METHLYERNNGYKLTKEDTLRQMELNIYNVRNERKLFIVKCKDILVKRMNLKNEASLGWKKQRKITVLEINSSAVKALTRKHKTRERKLTDFEACCLMERQSVGRMGIKLTRNPMRF